MNEEGVVYSELKLSHVKKASPAKRDPTSEKRRTTCKIIVGTTCFLFVLLIAGLGYMFFQKLHKGSTQDKKSREGNHTSSLVPEDDSTMSSSTERTLNSWNCFKRHCYYFSKQEVTWKESEKLCRNTHSSLVKIDDKEEQIFIQSKIKYSYWIGLYRTEAEHKWKWQDGTEPSDQLAFQNTTKMDGKCGCLKPRFIDSADCTRQLPYICEKNKGFFNN